ncbi:hypothetical protein B0H66DRAFT_561351 [Apodospora peruviana]|uniref:Uncharacterized protein n=1 Tax=Apodospora peruviana TaxID=516989 RepID=A0AAE0M2K7_9PEZI|nr:hypothetical protein B0H66DRAFT_561351 [Apodospora peruviana]
MDNWNTILRRGKITIQRTQLTYRQRIQQELEAQCEFVIREGVKAFVDKVFLEITKNISQSSQAIADDIEATMREQVDEPWAESIVPDEEVIVSMMARTLIRMLQRKYRADGQRPRVVIPEDAEVISIPGDNDLPSPQTLLRVDDWGLPRIKDEQAVIVEHESSEHGTGEITSPELALVPGDGEMAMPTVPATDESMNVEENVQLNKRPNETNDLGISSTLGSRPNKRARRHDHGISADQTDEEEPTENGTIHCSEVEGQDWIFEHHKFNRGHWFVVRCDRESHRSGIIHRFTKYPFSFNRAEKHFNTKKPKEKCHEEDIASLYKPEEIIRKFGYRVVGDELSAEWVENSNTKTKLASTMVGGASGTSSVGTRKRTRAKRKGGRFAGVQPPLECITPQGGDIATTARKFTSASGRISNSTSPQPQRPPPPQVREIRGEPAARRSSTASESSGAAVDISNSTHRTGAAPVADMIGRLFPIGHRGIILNSDRGIADEEGVDNSEDDSFQDDPTIRVVSDILPPSETP